MDSKYTTIITLTPHAYEVGNIVSFDGNAWAVVHIHNCTMTLRRVGWLRRLWWWIRAKFQYEVL